MDAWIYQAALLCGDCAIDRRKTLHCELLALADKDANSDVAPQGPYSDGGGEADSPQHCDHCGEFLENSLTSDGYAYVREMAEDSSSHSDVVRRWMDFYDISID